MFLRLLYRPVISSSSYSSYSIVDQKTFCCFVHIIAHWIDIGGTLEYLITRKYLAVVTVLQPTYLDRTYKVFLIDTGII